MEQTLKIAHLIITGLLVLSILSQSKGTGLSATFGGTGEFYATKRGAEKVLYYSTIVLAVLFVLLSLSYIYV
ncbi:preprotein translocase subunit SecG [bacterium]|jgi:protein translocase SecG subunit|nr:preprotein translocase subunit SecG [bacterium]MBT6293866.1 preprotein translocase subunit SecG [bacterium]